MNDEQIHDIYFYSQSADTPDNEIIITDYLSYILRDIYLKEHFLINYIFLNKSDIEEMNRQYLKHDYPTDIISFDFSDDFGVFGGDIFLCPEVIQDNALEYNAEYETELIRVMCHGILHLLGYGDKTEEEQIEIREQEELCLEIFRNREIM